MYCLFVCLFVWCKERVHRSLNFSVIQHKALPELKSVSVSTPLTMHCAEESGKCNCIFSQPCSFSCTDCRALQLIVSTSTRLGIKSKQGTRRTLKRNRFHFGNSGQLQLCHRQPFFTLVLPFSFALSWFRPSGLLRLRIDSESVNSLGIPM
jgi:hypothetical protein